MMLIRRISKYTAIAAAVFMTAAPLCFLCIGAGFAAANGELQLAGVNMTLLLKSVSLNAAAVFLCMLLGMLAALSLWQTFGRGVVKIAAVIPLALLVPPFIHIQAWIFAMDRLVAAVNSLLGLNLNFTGGFAVVLTTAFAYLPITAALGLVALLSIPQNIADHARLETNAAKTFRYVYLPYLLQFLCVGGALVFLLNVNDYGISSLFSVNTYALELFARFSAGYDKYSVFVCSLPLIAVSLCVLTALARYASNSGFEFDALTAKNPFKRERFLLFPKIAGLVISLLFVTVPLFNLIYESVKARSAAEILISSMPQFTYSICISIIAAILSAVIALPFAYYISAAKHKTALLSVSVSQFVVPSAIAGLAMICMWNTPLLGTVYRSPIMPAIALTAKYAFINILLFWFAISTLDKDLLGNMRVHYPGAPRAAWCCFRLIYKQFFAGLLITFALCMGEFGVTLLVTPPGYQTITLKIYNYLHYGASETIAVLCLFVLAVILASAAAVWLLLRRGDAYAENH